MELTLPCPQWSLPIVIFVCLFVFTNALGIELFALRSFELGEMVANPENQAFPGR